MKRFDLYLDETYVNIKKCNENDTIKRGMCVAGIIVDNIKSQNIAARIKTLKYNVWHDYYPSKVAKSFILHEAEIRSHRNKKVLSKHPEYKYFSISKNEKEIIKGIGEILDDFEIPVIGFIENETSISNKYLTKRNNNMTYTLAIKHIIDSFCYFLNKNDGVGYIHLESRATEDSDIQNKRLKTTFYQIMSQGTLHYLPWELQNHIKNINFIPKGKNNELIQIADFIPRPLILNYYKIPNPKPNIYQNIKRNIYNGDFYKIISNNNIFTTKKYSIIPIGKSEVGVKVFD